MHAATAKPEDHGSQCPLPHRRNFWERHGSWVLLGIVAVSCLGIGLQIGAQITFSQLTILNLQHATQMQSMQERHRAENAELTNKLAEATRQAACAATLSAGGSCTPDPRTNP